MADQDHNFDPLAQRFKRNVYDGLKGDIRLAVLKRDLAEAMPAFAGLLAEDAVPVADKLHVLDAGGGQGQLALAVAKLGHAVDLCDVSANMLAFAASALAANPPSGDVCLFHDSVQNHCASRAESYDVVLCHALLEWVAAPQALLAALESVVRPGGYLSLAFFNVNGIVMKNLLRGNFAKVLAEDYKGYRGSLTPPNPLRPETVYRWLAALNLEEVSRSGIRCFHDYLLDRNIRNHQPEDQLALELRLSRVEPFLSLGRYIHIILRRPLR
jgi:S-adenosylmethionine-dependent methyltransferase